MSLYADLKRTMKAHPVVARAVMARSTYLELRAMPAGMQRALKSLGYRKKDIAIRAGTSFSWGQAGSSGKQALVAVFDVSSGRVLDSEKGSWGGPALGSGGRVDDLRGKPQRLPEGRAVFQGYADGSYGSLVLHPSHFGLLQDQNAPVHLSADEQRALEAFHLKSGYRKREFEDYGLGEYSASNPLVQSLISKGLLVAKGRGISMTTKGRNYAR